ncbi:MAG: DUF1207 domain-containing protein [Bacteroidota bacterium]
MLRTNRWIWLTLLLPVMAVAQETPVEKTFLHSGNYFEPIFLDPTESQIFGSFVLDPDDNGSRNRYLIPFSISLNKGLYQWAQGPDHGWELRMELATFTVFEWAFLEEEWQRNLISTDYKGGLIINHRRGPHAFRLRMWHISSHLGDDYLIRNNITDFSPDPINYEQMDLTWAYEQPYWRSYVGIGSVVRPTTIRERLSMQAGGYYRSLPDSTKLIGYTAGLDVKLFAQNDYTPGWKLGAGLVFGQHTRHPIRVIGEYYNGHLPYSIFERTKLQWIGFGVYTSI